MRFDLSQYETVQQRLDAFHSAYPNGRVVTQLLEASATRYIICASIYKTDADAEPCATGHAEETVGSTPVNKTSAIENCETSAIGRALRNAGIGKDASQEEMQKVERGTVTKEVKQTQAGTRDSLIEQATAATTLDELRAAWSLGNAELLAEAHTWETEGGFLVGGTIADFMKHLAKQFTTQQGDNNE